MKTGHSKRPVNRQLQYKDVGVDKSNGWQPIETAPKDGTEILTICGNHYSVRAWGVGEDDDEAWLPRIRGVFPTHWIPLPKPLIEE